MITLIGKNLAKEGQEFLFLGPAVKMAGSAEVYLPNLYDNYPRYADGVAVIHNVLRYFCD